jgi:predicted permease
MAGDSAAAAVRAARGATVGRRLTLARQTLIVAQVALALVLVIGAGLLARTVRHLIDRPLGFATDGKTTRGVTMPGSRFASEAAQVRFEEALIAALGRLPGVEDVTASVGLPAHRAMGASLHIRGRATTTGLAEVGYNSIAPGFARMMRMPIVAGRDLTEADREGTTGAILVNEMMARQYWPEGDAIGAWIYLGPGRPDPGAWMEVVGVVADVRPYAAAESVTPTAYGSTRQYSWPRRYFTVHTPRRPATLEADMRAAVRSVDRDVSIGMIRELPAIAEAARGRHRLVMATLVIFSSVALALCASGLYAVAAMTSRLRRREYAIRIALGAPRGHVRWQVIGQSVWLAGLGIGAGLALAALGVGGIRGLLHGVESMDPSTFATAALTLALVAAAAAWLPARDAAHADPIDTLKAE